MVYLRIKGETEENNTKNKVTLWLDRSGEDIILMGYDDENIYNLLIFEKTGRTLAPTGRGINGLRTDGNGRLVIDIEKTKYEKHNGD